MSIPTMVSVGTLSYDRASALVQDRVQDVIRALSSETTMIKNALNRLIGTRSDEATMTIVPFLVAGIEGADPYTAVPLAAAHRLWWTAAHVFDDVIDGGELDYEGSLTPGESIMAAVVCGATLPSNILTADVPQHLLAAVLQEFFQAWLVSNDGQLLDLDNRVSGDRDRVLKSYLRKNGAAYGMACAAAARLARADDRRVRLWREFGYSLGLLGQFRNDQEDLAEGRDEDLRTSTMTYLLAHVMHLHQECEHTSGLIECLSRSAESSEAREKVKHFMLQPMTLGGYLSHITALREVTMSDLKYLAGTSPYYPALRRIVDEVARPLPCFEQRIDDSTQIAGPEWQLCREQVVLLTEEGRIAGVEDKAMVHHCDTPFHLAFSCYVFNDRGDLLVSQRAWTKQTWPGVWTNSACGHPAPGEELSAAVRRRVRREIGVHLLDLRLVLPGFRYRAVMDNGVTENEWCPVFCAKIEDDPVIDLTEINAFAWVRWDEFARGVLDGTREVSPWCIDQVTQLRALGHNPRLWECSREELPPAARLASQLTPDGA